MRAAKLRAGVRVVVASERQQGRGAHP